MKDLKEITLKELLDEVIRWDDWAGMRIKRQILSQFTQKEKEIAELSGIVCEGQDIIKMMENALELYKENYRQDKKAIAELESRYDIIKTESELHERATEHILKIPPKSKRKIKMSVLSIKKGKLRIVEPEGE